MNFLNLGGMKGLGPGMNFGMNLMPGGPRMAPDPAMAKANMLVGPKAMGPGPAANPMANMKLGGGMGKAIPGKGMGDDMAGLLAGVADANAQTMAPQDGGPMSPMTQPLPMQINPLNPMYDFQRFQFGAGGMQMPQGLLG